MLFREADLTAALMGENSVTKNAYKYNQLHFANMEPEVQKDSADAPGGRSW